MKRLTNYGSRSALIRDPWSRGKLPLWKHGSLDSAGKKQYHVAHAQHLGRNRTTNRPLISTYCPLATDRRFYPSGSKTYANPYEKEVEPIYPSLGDVYPTDDESFWKAFHETWKDWDGKSAPKKLDRDELYLVESPELSPPARTGKNMYTLDEHGELVPKKTAARGSSYNRFPSEDRPDRARAFVSLHERVVALPKHAPAEFQYIHYFDYLEWGWLRHHFTPKQRRAQLRKLRTWKIHQSHVRRGIWQASFPFGTAKLMTCTSMEEMAALWKASVFKPGIKVGAWSHAVLSLLAKAPEKVLMFLEASLLSPVVDSVDPARTVEPSGKGEALSLPISQEEHELSRETQEAGDHSAVDDDTLPLGYMLTDVFRYLNVHYMPTLSPPEKNHYADTLAQVVMAFLERAPVGHFPWRQTDLYAMIGNVTTPDKVHQLYQAFVRYSVKLHPLTLAHITSRLARSPQHKEIALQITVFALTHIENMQAMPAWSAVLTLLFTADSASVNSVNNANKEAVSAQRIWNVLLPAQFTPNLTHFTALIRNLCHLRDPRLAWKVFDILLEHNHHPDPVLLTTLLDGSSRSLDTHYVQRGLECILAYDLSDSVPVWNAVLTSIMHFALADVNMLKKFGQGQGQQHLHDSAALGTQRTKGHGNNIQEDIMQQAFELRQSQQVRNIPAFEATLQVYAQIFELAPLQRLLPADVLLDDMIHSQGPKGYRQWRFGNEVVPSIQAQVDKVVALGRPYLRPSAVTLRIMLLSYVQSIISQPAKVMAVLRHIRTLLLEEEPLLVGDRDMRSGMTDAQGGRDSFSAGQDSVMKEDGDHAETPSPPLANARTRLLTDEKALMAELPTFVYDITMKALSEWPDMLRAQLDLIHDMLTETRPDRAPRGSRRQRLHPAPSIYTWNILLRSWMLVHTDTRQTKRPTGLPMSQLGGSVSRYPRGHRHRRYTPSADVRSIESPSSTAQLQQHGDKVLELMHRHGVHPTAVTWNTLMASYASAQHVALTVQSLQRLVGQGFEPDTWTMRAISYLVDKERILELMEKMHSG